MTTSGPVCDGEIFGAVDDVHNTHNVRAASRILAPGVITGLGTAPQDLRLPFSLR